MSEFFSPYDADRPLMLKCSCGRDHTVADHHAEVSADAAAATLRQRSETREFELDLLQGGAVRLGLGDAVDVSVLAWDQLDAG